MSEQDQQELRSYYASKGILVSPYHKFPVCDHPIEKWGENCPHPIHRPVIVCVLASLAIASLQKKGLGFHKIVFQHVDFDRFDGSPDID